MKKIIDFMKKIKKYIYIFLILFSASLHYWAFWTSNTDDSEIILNKANTCLTAFKTWQSSLISQIENPFKKWQDKIYLQCKETDLAGWQKWILTQVLLDLLFSRIDSDVETYISSLSARKPDAVLIKEIFDKFGTDNTNNFASRYDEVCSMDSNSAFGYSEKFKKTFGYPDITTNFQMYTTQCKNLYTLKLAAYESAAINKVKRNASNAFLADKKTFMSKVRDKWEGLLTLFDRYISKFWIIVDGTPTFTPKSSQSPN